MNTTQNIRMSALYELEYEVISPEQKVMNRLKSHIEKGFRRQRQTIYYCQLMKLPIQELEMLSLKYWGCFVSKTIQSRLFSEDFIQLIFNVTKIQNVSY